MIRPGPRRLWPISSPNATHEGQPVSERTEVRVLIGRTPSTWRPALHGSRPKIRRRLVRRDEDLASDYLAVLIDSYHDHLTRHTASG